ncbi:MAG: hypothetical protein IKO06_05525, partial [Alphaproteobacteria bacterium]|nr:hypothetical protein [Alphaproteobacteria bacterium]
MKKIILLTSAAIFCCLLANEAMAECARMCGKYCCDKLTQDTENPNIYYDSLKNATYTISQNTETNETTVTVDATDLSNISSYTKKEYTYKSGKLISEASTPMRYLNYGGMYTGWVSWGNAGTTTYDYLTVGDDEYKLNNTPVNDNSGHYLIPEYTYMQNIDGTYTRSALVAGASSSFSYNIIDEISVSDGKAIIEHHTFRNFCNPMEPGCKHSYSTETYDKDGN